MTTASILDWTVSVLTMGSFLYASLRKEKVNESIQFNSINLLAGMIFAGVGLLTGLHGLLFRQLFFSGVALYNLVGIYRTRNTGSTVEPD
jgi:hypothetical protein